MIALGGLALAPLTATVLFLLPRFSSLFAADAWSQPRQFVGR